jgi:ATP-dependent Clp protease protease subunit
VTYPVANPRGIYTSARNVRYVEIAARDLIATRRMLAGIYEKTTKKSIEQILKDIDCDYYMTAEEARDYGLVDQIFSKEMRTGQSALT